MKATTRQIQDGKFAGSWYYCCQAPFCDMKLILGKDESPASFELEHKSNCPSGGSSHYGGSITLSLLRGMWDALDEEMVLAMDKENPDQLKNQYRARGMAKLISMFMVPVFPTEDDVIKEAARRFKAKKDGNLEYETAGLGRMTYAKPDMTDWCKCVKRDGWTRIDGNYVCANCKLPSRVFGPGYTESVRDISEDTIKRIKFAHDQGLFDVPALAQSFNLTAREVELIVQSA